MISHHEQPSFSHQQVAQAAERTDAMTTRKLARPSGLFFDEFAIGDQVESLGRTITESDIVNFAALSGDWNLIHTDAEYSKQHPFGQRVAHGLLILSVAVGLSVRLGFLEETTLAFRSIDWKMQRPVVIGDTIHVRITVEETKAMARLGGGLVNFKVEVFNQKDEVCQKGNWEMLVKGLEA